MNRVITVNTKQGANGRPVFDMIIQPQRVVRTDRGTSLDSLVGYPVPRRVTDVQTLANAEALLHKGGVATDTAIEVLGFLAQFGAQPGHTFKIQELKTGPGRPTFGDIR